MLPFGGDLRHGFQEEITTWQVAVRHLQTWQVDNEVVDCHDVNVDKAVHIVAVAVAVAVAVVEFVLDVVDDIQCLDRGVLALDGDSHVKEPVFALKSPRLTLHDFRACHNKPQVERQPQVGGPDVAFPVVEIGTYV